MPGPPPKPAAQRRRRNRTAATVMLPAESGVDAPPLDTDDDRTRAYWDTLWRSPMAAVWIAADVPALERLTRLQGIASAGAATAAQLAEIRQLEDRFGLSPMARRRLSYEIERATPTTTTTGEQRPAGRRLRAV